MKGSEIVKLLKQAGCFKVEDGANHERWYSPRTGKKFTVPRHYSKEIPKGTEQSIKKSAGLK